ncbi:hypothetical protein A4A49_66157, partial [Nicotiana attenuata]
MTITETRSKSMEDNVRKLENYLQIHIENSQKKAETTDAKIDDLAKKLDMLMDKLLPNQAGILGSAPTGEIQLEGTGNRSRGDQFVPRRAGERVQGHHHSSSRMEIPYFEGNGGGDPCSWLRRCERYFHYNQVVDHGQKLEEAVLLLQGRAEAWYFSYQLSKGHVS